MGFLAGEDRTCRSCRHGDVVNCENPVITGMTTDGGYAEIMLAEARGRARAGRSRCGRGRAAVVRGATTFNALRNAGARAGDVVAVHGLGAGHLAVQFANKMGFHTVAIARGAEAALARARIATSMRGPRRRRRAARARRAKVVLGTAPTGSGMADTVAGCPRAAS